MSLVVFRSTAEYGNNEQNREAVFSALYSIEINTCSVDREREREE